MASGKGGKSDPVQSKKETRAIKCILRHSQAKTILREISTLKSGTEAVEMITLAVTFLVQEIIEGSMGMTKCDKKKKIHPKHINQFIATDEDFCSFGTKWLIKSGGATKYMREALELAKKK